MLILLPFLFFSSVVCLNVSKGALLDISKLLKDFQVGYDRRVRPDYGGSPVFVKVSLYVLSVEEINEMFMDYTFDMYFRQFWVDGRLTFQKTSDVDQLVVGADYIKQIWVPDTFFVNEKVARFHAATQENQFLRITHKGEILRSMRLTVKATCPMDLTYFPMDSQMCTLEIESYGYTMDDMVYVWQEEGKSVTVSPDVSLAEFYVVGYRQRRVLEVLTSGNYSRLCADILFSRSMGYYIIQVYVPSSLIVVMSWVSFYLDRKSAPARVGLGVTTVLTMVTLMSSVNRSLPKISYMKALDVYLAFCFWMVFGALLEYATVSYTGKRIKLNQRRFEEFKQKVEALTLEMERQQANSRVDLLPTNTRSPFPLTAPTTLCGVRDSDIERMARVAFPIIFISFHTLYWTILFRLTERHTPDLIPLHPEA